MTSTDHPRDQDRYALTSVSIMEIIQKTVTLTYRGIGDVRHRHPRPGKVTGRVLQMEVMRERIVD
ncbi:hypothetical protein ColTof4_00671 [Colletotrichum tofieldiae]|nr:hypothetical protein ColTof3_07882 [Colletotrichum tofieldiae]GKT68248.1 hypothetical protein ColTof4_00671 [Colletotrichum tofieldiae]GKT90744.1 hypothetical protein Ct61P_08594 [Colletotrichum tofieldiae]